MRPVNIIDIGYNDGWQVAAAKINSNFKQLHDSVMYNSGNATEVAKAGLSESIAEARAELEAAVEAARADMSAALADAERRIEEMVAELTSVDSVAPPVGTYLFSDRNPAETWIGTAWERQPENLYLVASGAKVQTGARVGRNDMTLGTANMPQHSHTGPSHSHTLSHTHPAGSLATGSAGGHSHGTLWGGWKFMVHSGNYPSFGADSYSGDLPGTARKLFRIGSDQSFGSNSATGSAGAHTHSMSGNTGAASSATTSTSGTQSTGTAGESKPFDNRPLSLAAPLWKRTA